jgi:hypothetical protein
MVHGRATAIESNCRNALGQGEGFDGAGSGVVKAKFRHPRKVSKFEDFRGNNKDTWGVYPD